MFFLWGVCVWYVKASSHATVFCSALSHVRERLSGQVGMGPHLFPLTHIYHSNREQCCDSKVLLLHRRDHSGTQETCLKNEQPHAGMLLNTKSQDLESF